jgi:RNA polymerase primary sigma factor
MKTSPFWLSVQPESNPQSTLAEAPAPEYDSLRLYLQEIARTPLLTASQETALALRVRCGDQTAREEMIKANLRLVVSIARAYANYGLPLADLICEGNIGLTRAVDRFDPCRGAKLSTYAAFWIKHTIRRAISDQSRDIRLPVSVEHKIAELRRTATTLSEQLGRDPTIEEIALELDVPVKKVAHLKSVSSAPASLDAPVDAEHQSATLGEITRDENAGSPYESLCKQNWQSDLGRMLDSLDKREAEVIRMRFGLDGNDELTLEQVGERFNVAQERVRQIEALALRRLRKLITCNESIRNSEGIQLDELLSKIARSRKRKSAIRPRRFATKARREQVQQRAQTGATALDLHTCAQRTVLAA